MTYGWHWFRRDLRIAGNQALLMQQQKYLGKVVGVFCFDKVFLARSDFSTNRFQFFLESLLALREELRSVGSDLLVLDTGPLEAFSYLINFHRQNHLPLPDSITWCRDYEPFARERDQRLLEFFHEQGIATAQYRDHLLIEPEELAKPGGGVYKVYSPFARRWHAIAQEPAVARRVAVTGPAVSYLEARLNGHHERLFNLSWAQLWRGIAGPLDVLEDYVVENSKQVTVPIPKAGSLQAYQVAKEFTDRLASYGEQRDLPAASGTSQLSPYLKNGSITTGMLMGLLKLKPFSGKRHEGAQVFLSELVWREFYYHILFHFPQVETGPFLSQYQGLSWTNEPTWFEAWKAGRTGFPIVDAGMRQLKSTGWMHNRVRMIVASFLCKDLLINWQWGEAYFMEALLDGDLAANNGGWQWAASTGCDPQPYFRIFNPWLQSKKFDPEGRYIKTYLPELAGLPAKSLHQPVLAHPSYPEPICDHKTQRDLALAMYKAVRD